MMQTKTRPFTLTKLPYAPDALQPVISALTIRYHYSKHHKGYVDKLNELVLGTEFEEMSLEEVILNTKDKTDKTAVFNNAAQVWNHDFYWNSLSPGGRKPSKDLARSIEAGFGSCSGFLEQFAKAGVSQFGSGWVWLVEKDGALEIVSTSDAENPMSTGQGKALLTLDVWEHAYYLDHQNRRQDYLAKALEKLLHWDFAEVNLHS